MNFVVPIVGNNNKVYGVCGFEISENYFKKYFAQSTQLEHLTCMFFPKNGGTYNTVNGFSAGVYGGYYLPPQGELTVEDMGGGLTALHSRDGNSSFVSKAQSAIICGDEYVLIVSYPKEEYDKTVANNVISVVLLVLLLVGMTVAVCVFFSKRFLRPLLKGIEQIQKQEHKNAESEFVEIDDLLHFLPNRIESKMRKPKNSARNATNKVFLSNKNKRTSTALPTLVKTRYLPTTTKCSKRG